jgi:hypothetical protein
MKRSTRIKLGIAAAIVIVHAVLSRALANVDFMQALAEARRGHAGVALAVGMLMVVRLIVIVVLPASLIAGVGSAIAGRISSRNSRARTGSTSA